MNKNNDKFTSYNFLRLLLALLYQNEIYKIDENELERKLFYYWKIEGFSELFRCLLIEDTSNHKSVILYDEFSKEKSTKYVSFDKRNCGRIS
jgi:hypothetical protein